MKSNFQSIFSKVIYILALMDAILWSVFFYKISGFSKEKYMALDFTGFGFWFDYLVVCIFLMTFLPACMHYNRHEFTNETAMRFNTNSLQTKLLTVIFCDVLPFLLLFSTPKMLVTNKKMTELLIQ